MRGMREKTRGDFVTRFHDLLRHLPLQIDLSLPAELQGPCPLTTHMLLRSVRADVKNAVQYRQPRQVWLAFQQAPVHLNLKARDDGRGASQVKHGCSLTGMQERFQSLGGTFYLETRPEQGLNISVPRRSEQ